MSKATLTSCDWIPDLGLPSWCSSKEWLAIVDRDEVPMRGAHGRAKDRDRAIDIAFAGASTWGPQEEVRGEREQRRLF